MSAGGDDFLSGCLIADLNSINKKGIKRRGDPTFNAVQTFYFYFIIVFISADTPTLPVIRISLLSK